MQFGKTEKEYMSRKYTLTLLALVTESFKLITTADPTWATALCIAIPATIAQYAYFNVSESKTIRPPAAKPPVEEEG